MFLSRFRNMLWRGRTLVKKRENSASPRFLSTLSRVLPRHSMFLKLDRNTCDTVLFLYYKPFLLLFSANVQALLSMLTKRVLTAFLKVKKLTTIWSMPLMSLKFITIYTFFYIINYGCVLLHTSVTPLLNTYTRYDTLYADVFLRRSYSEVGCGASASDVNSIFTRV